MLRASEIASATCADERQRATSAGCRSMSPFQTLRASS
jgi:hypothetical protein